MGCPYALLEWTPKGRLARLTVHPSREHAWKAAALASLAQHEAQAKRAKALKSGEYIGENLERAKDAVSTLIRRRRHRQAVEAWVARRWWRANRFQVVPVASSA